MFKIILGIIVLLTLFALGYIGSRLREWNLYRRMMSNLEANEAKLMPRVFTGTADYDRAAAALWVQARYFQQSLKALDAAKKPILPHREIIDEYLKRGDDPIQTIIEAGSTRMTPVLLTAASTILGLLPLALGININFITLFTELDPQIYFGGDNVAFWNPLAWTIIFGLAFATFLTLVVVPVMYRMIYVKK